MDLDDDNIEQLVPGSRHALIAAAQNGHLDIVEYLLDTAELIVSVVKSYSMLEISDNVSVIFPRKVIYLNVQDNLLTSKT